MSQVKDHLYQQVARVGKALASPKRLELLELLCQGEKAVELLAEQAAISIKLASAHLKALREARLVETRRDGKYILYRLASDGVADLWVALRSQAEERLVELQLALKNLVDQPNQLEALDREMILARARTGEVVILDVRPEEEFAAAHLPFARSLPVAELGRRLKEIPTDTPVVAYCRGPFCLMARDAVELLRKKGYRAQHLQDGVAEWRANGFPIEA